MLYLIDGYNLLYAMGVLHKRMGPKGLEKARQNLLGVLHGSFGDECNKVTVVFDAAKPPPGVPAQAEYHGLHVRFAIGLAAADDLIEQVIRKASAPRHLTVVSDDHRIQDAARRRRCVATGCADFLQALQRRRKPPAPEQPAKPAGTSRQETQHWLDEFADLADDPAMKELQDPPEFFEGE